VLPKAHAQPYALSVLVGADAAMICIHHHQLWLFQKKATVEKLVHMVLAQGRATKALLNGECQESDIADEEKQPWTVTKDQASQGRA